MTTNSRIYRSLTLLAVVAMMQSCGGGDSEDNPPNPAHNALIRVSNTACLAPVNGSGQLGQLSLVPAFPNLPSLPGLVGLYQAPGDSSSWYALLRAGQIYRFANSADASATTLVLDIGDHVRQSGEMGLTGLAFHPDYATNGFLYVVYNDRNNSGASTLSRFTTGASLPIAMDTQSVILTLAQPASNHNGGGIAFDRDGYLYVGFGDGGGANDAFGHGQNGLTWHGSLLRIDVDGAEPYEVPNDNPFVGNNNFAPETYAFGLRNPWRWSFDQQNGALWLADVGQNRWEEVDIVNAGDNLGWPITEGSECFNTLDCDTANLRLPVSEYRHGDGDCSISGGYVYYGDSVPQLAGSYLYADYCSGKVRRTWRDEQDRWQSEVLISSGRSIAAFGQAHNGEVLVLDIAGGAGNGILKIQDDAPVPVAMPDLLSDAGCFASTEAKTMAAGVVSYDVNSPLWSDGAAKRRHFAIPDGTMITADAQGDLHFPNGSVLIKHFLDGERYLETRLLTQRQNTWQGFSYEWMEDGTDARLLSQSKYIESENFQHYLPSSNECQVCHTSAAGQSLGLEALQLNREHAYAISGRSENQLTALAQAGFIAEDLSRDFGALVSLADDTESIASRARSYLHSNCSGCHRPEGVAGVDMRFTTALAQTGMCDTVPANGDFAIDGARIIAPGNSEASVLLHRMRIAGSGRMPPLATDVEDSEATEVIAQWINSLTSCD